MQPFVAASLELNADYGEVSRTSILGREGEVVNGRFGAFQFAESEFG